MTGDNLVHLFWTYSVKCLPVIIKLTYLDEETEAAEPRDKKNKIKEGENMYI